MIVAVWRTSWRRSARSRSTHRRGRDAFERDELVRVWITHHLQIIGEAARGLSLGLRSSNPELPWTQMIAMRNILVHEYFGVEPEELWATVENDLPEFKRKIEAVLRELSEAE